MLRPPRRNAPLFVDTLAPMLFEQRKLPLAAESQWIAEIKYDGYRGLAEVAAEGVALRSKNGADCTAWFPEVALGLAELALPHPTVLDGEYVVLDDLGRSDFDELHARARRRRRALGAPPVVYCAFDILVHDGKPVTALPLFERKKLLGAFLAPGAPAVLAVGFISSADVPNPVSWLYERALTLKLEGVVAKQVSSPYVPGARTAHWLKFKRPGAVPAGRFSRDMA